MEEYILSGAIKNMLLLLMSQINAKKCDMVDSLRIEDLQELLSISKKHDLAHLVGDVLDKNGLLPEGSEIKKRFVWERNLAVFRYEQQQYEFEQTCNVLEENRIPFLPLKGSVIRRLYPEPWMRTSCDIDVLIPEENLDQAQSVLEKELGYKFLKNSNHDVSLLSESGVHLELHYNLLENSMIKSERSILGKIWDVAEREEGKNAHCKMPDEYFYCYHISHIAKHLKIGGCGVRAVLDTWILNHKIEFDKKKRDEVLERAGVLAVAKGLENLAEVWFSGAEADELSKNLGNYILTGELFGTIETKVAVLKIKQKNKFLYLWSRVFIPYSQFKFQYPALQKYPILYPFYIVKRLCLLLNKDKRKRALKEINQMVNDDEVQQDVAVMMQELGL